MAGTVSIKHAFTNALADDSLSASLGMVVPSNWNADHTIADGGNLNLDSIVCPLLSGGSGAASTLTLQSTTGTGTTDAIIFKTGSQVEAGRFETGASLLLGTTAPIPFGGATDPKLQVAGTGASGSSFGLARFANSANAGFVGVGKSRGTTVGSYTVLNDGDGLGSYNFYGADGSGLVLSAQLTGLVDGSPSAGNVPGSLRMGTVPQGGGANITHGLTMDSAQNVSIGLPNLDPAATDGFLQIASGAGTPTGVPNILSGFVPIYIDTTNNQLWLYLGGSWKQPKTPAGAALVTWQ